MKSKFGILVSGMAALALVAGTALARGRDPDVASKAQERLDKETAKVAERADEMAARYTEERIKIEERAIKDPTKAAEDLAKLDADIAKDEVKSAEDAAKVQEDFAEESAKEAEEAAEEAAELSDRGDDSGHGSSEQIRDLGKSEGADHDADGFAIKRGELVAVDLSSATVTAAEAQGFRVIGREKLPTLQREMVRLATPAGVEAVEGLIRLRALDPAATVDLVHYYGLGLTAGEQGRPISRRSPAPAGSSAPLAVAVIDTGIASHRALNGARIVVWPAGAQGGGPVEHGTAVASLLAQEGRATIWSANIFRGSADRPFTSAEVIAEAFEWATAQGAQTINMSLAGPRNAILDRLVRDAIGQGRIVVAAAGNGGPSAPPAYPAAVRGVVAVTAVDKDLRIYRYANHGRYITVAAQGVDVIAAHATGGQARYSGTSFATPHVAGWLARCRATGANAAVCTARLRRAARDLGTTGFDETYGYGFIG
jgi:subtilisin family serine protease